MKDSKNGRKRYVSFIERSDRIATKKIFKEF